MPKPRIAVTLGDPGGISYEIVCKAVDSLKVQRVCSPVIFGDKQIFNCLLKKYCRNKKNFEFTATSNLGNVKCSIPTKKSGLIAVSAIKEAVKYCLNNKIKALVTAPVSKESLKFAGITYPGHTELLANLTNSKKIAMLMACNNILGVTVTRHIPISYVSKNLKTKNIVQTILLSIDFIKKNKRNIKIALCGLNPHAGDNSILGNEEKKIIIPAYKKLVQLGVDITPPIPADSAWLKAKQGQFDLICTMYHDQLMIPLKCIDASKIVNITAGLPFIRTSPGHGTAFDIAGKNVANPSAMIESMIYAAKYLFKQT
ncbi:MAG: 4-hydroxythreonine-4-phosphate dehydrogenase PdxA [Endomicrobium sp.]|jgi:4-hydroxythreonine-4-phosphate dehydrogenase|uniref:4-hydroxythreonine-4-phosphate dehydrogenase PdxA n=1 Tax=Candidatus Endomicrobiellum cubanum TaxID=3242325 RepID=UPI00282750FD|nr:4-hydroxythreonine-4-phosphate dehydrogenase PdxA [Endomicrobium sp.]